MNPYNLNSAKIILTAALAAFFCGCQKQENKPSSNSGSGSGSAIVSAEKTSFDEVTSKLDKGGNFYLYLSTEQALADLSAKIASVSNFVGNLPGIPSGKNQNLSKGFEFINDWIKDSGVEEISGVGMSSIAREPDFYYSKFVVHHYLDKNDGLIWSVFGKSAHPLEELNLLPETTALASFSDLNLALAWNNIEKHLEALDVPAVTYYLQQWPTQFNKATGLDFDKVLASLGGNFGIILTLDEQNKITLPVPGAPMEIPSPGLAIIVRVKSDLIFDRVDKLGKGNPMVRRVDESDLKMRTMAIPLPLPVELRPSIARSGDYLILATTDTLIRDMLAIKSGKKKGFKSTAIYARLSQGMPAEGNSFSFVGDQFVKTMMQAQQQALVSKGTMTPAQVGAMQHTFSNGTNYDSYSVGAIGSEGWEGYANGSQGIQTVIVAGVAGLGAMAAVAVPAFVKARATAHQKTVSPMAHPAPQSPSSPDPGNSPGKTPPGS